MMKTAICEHCGISYLKLQTPLLHSKFLQPLLPTNNVGQCIISPNL